jgi:hypothetical protein
MPALTDLRLKDSIPDDSEGSSTYPVVDLPCLRVLHISSGVGALTTVLRHITILPSAIWNLTCRETQSTQIDFTNFLSVLSAKFLSSLVIRRLSLQVLDVTKNLRSRIQLLDNCKSVSVTTNLQVDMALAAAPQPCEGFDLCV